MTKFLIEMDTIFGTTNRNGRKEFVVTEEQLEEMTAEFEAFDGLIIDVLED